MFIIPLFSIPIQLSRNVEGVIVDSSLFTPIISLLIHIVESHCWVECIFICLCVECCKNGVSLNRSSNYSPYGSSTKQLAVQELKRFVELLQKKSPFMLDTISGAVQKACLCCFRNRYPVVEISARLHPPSWKYVYFIVLSGKRICVDIEYKCATSIKQKGLRTKVEQWESSKPVKSIPVENICKRLRWFA